MIRRLAFALSLLAVLLAAGTASSQEATREDEQQALQKKFAWAVEATRDYIASAEDWPESDYAILLTADDPDQPRTVVARVVGPDNPFSDLPECPISPPICWNELHFAVETRKIFYLVWGN